MIKLIKAMYDILAPRFITEKVAMSKDENDQWFVVCLESEIEPDDCYICIGTSRCFNFFGIALRPKVTLPEGY